MKHTFFALAALLAIGSAQAAELSLAGNIVNQKDLVQIDFSIASPGAVTLWTDSWQLGVNFDPQLSLYSAAGSLLANFDDNFARVATAGDFDASQFFAALAAGQYHLVLSASSNNPNGNTLASGFSYDADAPIALTDWTQPGVDINSINQQKGGFWRVNLSGVDQAGVVPEPASLALVLAGLLGLGVARRRRD